MLLYRVVQYIHCNKSLLSPTWTAFSLCVCVCMCVCVCVCVCVCACACACAWLCVSVCLSVYLCVTTKLLSSSKSEQATCTMYEDMTSCTDLAHRHVVYQIATVLHSNSYCTVIASIVLCGQNFRLFSPILAK